MQNLKEIQELNKEIFNIFELLFVEAFGVSPQKFSSIDKFGSKIREVAKDKVNNIKKSLEKYLPEIYNFYDHKANKIFKLLKTSGGLKYVLGGGSHFLPTHFRAVKSMSLYADTILIPDPVFPWIETDRKEERFRHVKILEQIFMLLHLKPIIDANLPYPAVSIFPSLEKTREKSDPVTKEGIDGLVKNFFSFYLQIPFQNCEEIISYLKKYPKEFLERVNSKNLFIAPGSANESIKETVKNYREYINKWRSIEYQKNCSNLSDAELVWLGINERIAPQFHWWENSNELKAHPLSCIEQQWYYHQLTSEMLSGMVNSNNLKKLNPIDNFVQLNNKRFEWLGNLTIDELVRLREEGENEEFRSEIKKALDHLNASTVVEVDDVAIEIAKTISNLIFKHQRTIKEINKRYFKKYGQTILFAATGSAACFIPVLAPGALTATAIGTVSVTSAKLVWDIIGHADSLKKASKSLMGVFTKYQNN